MQVVRNKRVADATTKNNDQNVLRRTANGCKFQLVITVMPMT